MLLKVWLLLMNLIPLLLLSQDSQNLPIIKNKINNVVYYNIPQGRAEILELKARQADEWRKLNVGLSELIDQVVDANLKTQSSTMQIQREYSRLLKTCSEVDYKFKVLVDENTTLKNSLKKSDEIIVFKDKEIEKAKKEKWYMLGGLASAAIGLLLIIK